MKSMGQGHPLAALAASSRWGLLAMAALVWGGGCTGPALGAKAATDRGTARDESAAVSKEDQARCEFEGRSDRDARETSGPGAIQPNIRRVYALVGEGVDRRKVLICREVDTNLDGLKDVVRLYDDQGQSDREVADSDYDGRMDTWMTFRDGRLSKSELDTNGDGQPNETRYYLRGRLRRIQRDTNADGDPDVWEIYNEGRLQRLGEDLDHDGRVDRWNRDEVAARGAKAIGESERAEGEAAAGSAEAPQTATEGGGEPAESPGAGSSEAPVSPRDR